MMSMATSQDDERHQRLAAIAQLEQQHKMRRSGILEDGQSDPFSTRSGKYFVLLVSKGSGNLEQRANQDRAETMLHEYPHEILDGSNFALSAKREELFEISKIRGNYPQLFLVDNEVTTFLGDFDMIEYHNDEGKLGSLLEETQPKSPKKKASIARSVKSLLKSSSRKAMGDVVSPSKSTKSTVSTEPLSTRSMSRTEHTTTSSVDDEVDAASKAIWKRTPRKDNARRSSFGPLAKTPFLLEEEDENPAKPASTGRLILSKSEGDMPLFDDDDMKKSKGEYRSRSKGRTKDNHGAHSKSRPSCTDGEVSRKDEDCSENNSKKTSTKSRSSSESKYKHRDRVKGDDVHDDGEKKENISKTSKHRSSSRGRLDESSKDLGDVEERDRKKSPRPSSRGKFRDSVHSSKEGDDCDPKKSNSASKKSRGDGEMNLNEELRDESEKKSTQSRTFSKRNLRVDDSESKQGEDEDDDEEGMKDRRPKPRKSRSRGQLMSKTGEDRSIDSEDSPVKQKGKLRLREQDGEKHPTGRRRNGQSSSPHRLREKTIVRSCSPGTYRGDIARKREAMKEIRERKSMKNVNAGEDGTETGRKPRKHHSVGTMDASGLSVLSSPRRHQSLLNIKTRNKEPGETEESLHELVKRVKDKEKRDKIDEEGAEDDTNQVDSAVSSVQW